MVDCSRSMVTSLRAFSVSVTWNRRSIKYPLVILPPFSSPSRLGWGLFTGGDIEGALYKTGVIIIMLLLLIMMMFLLCFLFLIGRIRRVLRRSTGAKGGISVAIAIHALRLCNWRHWSHHSWRLLLAEVVVAAAAAAAAVFVADAVLCRCLPPQSFNAFSSFQSLS